MMERRHLVTGGIFSALAATIRPATAETDPAPQRDRDDETARAVRELIQELRAQRLSCAPATCPEIQQIRAAQRIYLRANNRFPEFIEVGIDFWDAVQDWHIRNLQPLQVSRTGDGRYTMLFNNTTVVLRPELPGTHLGQPFDSKVG